MRPPAALAITLATLALSGCGERPAPPAAAPATTDRGVFDAQIQAIDKAKGVESTLQDQADAQRRALEEQER